MHILVQKSWWLTFSNIDICKILGDASTLWLMNKLVELFFMVMYLYKSIDSLVSFYNWLAGSLFREFSIEIKKQLLTHSLKSNHPINNVRLSKIHCFSRKYAFFLMITRLDTLFSFNFFLKIHKPCVQAEKISILQKTVYVLQVVSLIYINIFLLTFLYMFKSFNKMHKIRLMEINVICHDMFGWTFTYFINRDLNEQEVWSFGK